MRKAGEKAPTARRPWGRRAGMCWRACGHYPAPGFGGDSPVSPGVLTESGLVEVNFLCVHKKLRSKRLAPVLIKEITDPSPKPSPSPNPNPNQVLIKEITRRCNLCGIFQAAYTAGIVLPKPVACCRYYHRSLNPKKLIEVGLVITPRHPDT